MNTKTYPLRAAMEERSEPYADARESIKATVKDPISQLLQNCSHLTLAQLETLLADSISNEKASKKGQRHLFRPSRKILSRGSYNRTLIQAQNNVIRSIYTILLLGYVGLFDTPSLQPFLELSDGIQGYIDEIKAGPEGNSAAVDQLRPKLSDAISALARRHSFKDILS